MTASECHIVAVPGVYLYIHVHACYLSSTLQCATFASVQQSPDCLMQVFCLQSVNIADDMPLLMAHVGGPSGPGIALSSDLAHYLKPLVQMLEIGILPYNLSC